MLAQRPNVVVGEFRAAGESVIREAPAFNETVCHQSRDEADWIFIANIDEFRYHPDGKGHFNRCIRQGVTIIHGTGYEMIALAFPPADWALARSITSGARAKHMD